MLSFRVKTHVLKSTKPSLPNTPTPQGYRWSTHPSTQLRPAQYTYISSSQCMQPTRYFDLRVLLIFPTSQYPSHHLFYNRYILILVTCATFCTALLVNVLEIKRERRHEDPRSSLKLERCGVSNVAQPTLVHNKERAHNDPIKIKASLRPYLLLKVCTPCIA